MSLTPWPTRREYYRHSGPGWDFRMSQPEYNWDTGEVDSDDPSPAEIAKQAMNGIDTFMQEWKEKQGN